MNSVGWALIPLVSLQEERRTHTHTGDGHVRTQGGDGVCTPRREAAGKQPWDTGVSDWGLQRWETINSCGVSPRADHDGASSRRGWGLGVWWPPGACGQDPLSPARLQLCSVVNSAPGWFISDCDLMGTVPHARGLTTLGTSARALP